MCHWWLTSVLIKLSQYIGRMQTYYQTILKKITSEVLDYFESLERLSYVNIFSSLCKTDKLKFEFETGILFLCFQLRSEQLVSVHCTVTYTILM